MQISLIVDPSRSWPNLWKMAIDALDPILGRSFPDDEWDPKDGRVVRLGIHVREDRSVGWDVPFVIRARPAALDWPEMTWFAAMGETERAEWLANHEAPMGPAPALAARHHPAGRPPASLSHPEGGSAPAALLTARRSAKSRAPTT